jgi:hypothetical protein
MIKEILGVIDEESISKMVSRELAFSWVPSPERRSYYHKRDLTTGVIGMYILLPQFSCDVRFTLP